MTTRSSSAQHSWRSHGRESPRHSSVAPDDGTVDSSSGLKRLVLPVLIGGGCVLLVAVGFWSWRRDRVPSTKLEVDAEPALIARRDYPRASIEQHPSEFAGNHTGMGRVQSHTNASPVPNVTPQVAAKLGAEQAIKELETSGAAAGHLSASTWKVVEQWKGIASVAGTEFADFRCFKSGCTVTSTHADPASAQLAGDDIMRPDHLGWLGEAFRSGPLHDPSGRVQFVWILYSADRPTTVGPSPLEQ